MGLGPLGEKVFYIHIYDINKQVKHLWVDGRWSFDGIVTMLPVEVKDYIRAIPFAMSLNEDYWVWNHRLDGNYIVKATYN